MILFAPIPTMPSYTDLAIEYLGLFLAIAVMILFIRILIGLFEFISTFVQLIYLIIVRYINEQKYK
jgi:hypothetical protein